MDLNPSQAPHTLGLNPSPSHPPTGSATLGLRQSLKASQLELSHSRQELQRLQASLQASQCELLQLQSSLQLAAHEDSANKARLEGLQQRCGAEGPRVEGFMLHDSCPHHTHSKLGAA